MRIEGKYQRLLLNLNLIPHGLKKKYSLLFLRRSDDDSVGVARVRDITVSPRTRIAFNFEAEAICCSIESIDRIRAALVAVQIASVQRWLQYSLRGIATSRSILFSWSRRQRMQMWSLVELAANAEPRICASEHGSTPCTCNGLVVYGKMFVSAKHGKCQLTTIHDILKTKKYKTTKAVHGLPIECGNDAMGGDPFKGHRKHCYCLESPKQGG